MTGVAGRGCVNLGTVFALVDTFSDGRLVALTVGIIDGDCAVGVASVAGLISRGVVSFLGDEGAESILGLASSLNAARPFRDIRTRISSKLGSPFASIRLVGEHAPEDGAFGDKHVEDCSSCLISKLEVLVGEGGINGLLRSLPP